jgi:hypothetical protein
MMRSFEFIKPITERKSTSPVRYNSEVGVLFGLISDANVAEFDPTNPEATIPRERLTDPDKVLGYIKNFLTRDYDPTIFSTWVNNGRRWKSMIYEKGGVTDATKFGWAAGNNRAGGPFDISFQGAATGGISIKAGSFMLANLKPKALGLTTVRGEDIFITYGNEAEWVKMKQQIFADLLDFVTNDQRHVWPEEGAKYSIKLAEDGNFDITDGVTTKKFTRETILASVKKNAAWQRVFGDWFNVTENWNKYKVFMKPYFAAIAKQFEVIIEKHIQTDNQLTKLLQFKEVPYFYLNDNDLYLVPTAEAAADIRLIDLKYTDPDGTGQRFLARLGHPGATAFATLDVYVRYASGMFKTNPTARLQGFTNPENVAWTKLSGATVQAAPQQPTN